MVSSLARDDRAFHGDDAGAPLGDVVGFLHTHPAGPASPSGPDVRTMRAWRRALGKPLLCLIAGPQSRRG